MRIEKLNEHIRMLATLPETESPVVSCYIDLMKSSPGWRHWVQHRIAQLLTGAHNRTYRNDLDVAFDQIRKELKTGLTDDTKGVAIFSRNDDSPFILTIWLPVRITTWISVDSVPDIVPLISLKDSFHRYVILITDREKARILEINLGAVSRELWLQRPKLCKRIGREWTKTHYQNHRHERDAQFVREKIAIINRIMDLGDHNHLVLAGDPQRIAEIRRSLPQNILDKTIDVLPLSQKPEIDETIAGALDAIIGAGERESQNILEKLANAFYKDNLAVIGSVECMQALLRNEVDILVISKTSEPEIIRWCDHCKWAAAGDPLPLICAECGNPVLHERPAREEIIRLAEANGCRVEVLKESKALERIGNVACLLRFAYDNTRRNLGQVNVYKETST